MKLTRGFDPAKVSDEKALDIALEIWSGVHAEQGLDVTEPVVTYEDGDGDRLVILRSPQ